MSINFCHATLCHSLENVYSHHQKNLKWHSSRSSGSSTLLNNENAILIMPYVNIVAIVLWRSYIQILTYVSCSDIFLGVPRFLHECEGSSLKFPHLLYVLVDS